MNKEEWIWVAIKIFGIYLLVLAIITLPTLLTAIYSYHSVNPFITHYNTETANETSKLLSQYSKAQFAYSIKSIAQVLIYTAFGIYFIKSGNFIHKVICKTL